MTYPFQRVQVQYVPLGGTRVFWDLDGHFKDPPPYAFQLQVLRGSAPSADDWADVGLAADTYFAIDDTQRLYGKTFETHYRVVLTTPVSTYVSQTAGPTSALDFRNWRLQQEVLRKEYKRALLYASVAGSLLKERRYGTPCPDCVDPLINDVNDAKCLTCFGVGILKGYYPAVPGLFRDPGLTSTREAVEASTQGTTKDEATLCRIVGAPQLNSRDVWVDEKSGQRYFMEKLTDQAKQRDSLVVQEAELRLAPLSHIVYKVPL